MDLKKRIKEDKDLLNFFKENNIVIADRLFRIHIEMHAQESAM